MSILDERFDDLAKVVAGRGHSRRSALKVGVAALAAVGFSVRPARAGAADAPAATMTCAEFCSRIFPPGEARGRCIGDAGRGTGLCYECGPKAPPKSGRVVCGTVCCSKGLGCCNGECTALTTTQNCGACGNSCPEGTVCSGGQCLCPDGQPTCFGRCCPEGSFCNEFYETCQCSNGQLACGAPFAVCCNGRECCEGVCCPEGYGCCGGVCCNHVCCPAFRPTSQEGVCCPPDAGTCCNGECTNLSTSEEHCGNCNSPCPPATSCCQGECFDLTSDPRQCGACGVECLPGQECVNGECRCPEGGVVCALDPFNATVCCSPGAVCCVHPFAPEGECLSPEQCARLQA